MKTTRLLITFLLISLSLPAMANHHGEPKKAVLVTGASSGLGLKMTEVLSANGFLVYAGARKEADLKRLEAMENVESIKLDVTIQSEIDAAVKLVESKGRGLYGLINNAGVGIFGPLLEVGVDQLQYQFDVNVYGPYRVTQAFAPLIIESKGRIATTGSIAGIRTGSMFGLYGMSKHAIEAYTEALAAEMARFGVNVSVVEPGNYASKIGNTAKKRIEATNYWSEDTRYSTERTNMMGGLANTTKGNDPLAVAQAMLDIMSSDNPKFRYMVVASEAQANNTIRSAVRKTVQLNHQQEYSYDRKKLIEMLDQELAEIEQKK